ncbi:MAG TPA: Stk1 family PASTA domain-containing Ser/Thr kinase [Anaerovoracaceae bacterium]|nr:Stk1 family PASTA domain-containing Ser/Thr kinase [Anaerovoracaceae bacterium]
MSSRVLAERYELIEKIGEGGMAVVYKSRDKLLNRYVAIKILKPEFTKDYKFIESFRRESQAAASMSHPHIVNIYDVGREGNINYIVMELIEGQPLSSLIKKRKRLKPREAVIIARQIASALSHAHKNHIIHRDVKPHNILMTDDGTAKIADFGIAKAVNAGTIVTNAGAVMGSVHYFSPEQARGGYVDEKSDIYSLGVVMYEMLTGQVPFDAENPVAVAMKHMNEEIIPPSALAQDVPHDIEEIVLKATDKYQTNRYKTADEMVDALNRASLSSAGVYAGKSSTKENNSGTEDGMSEDGMLNNELNNADTGHKMKGTSRGEKSMKEKKKFRPNKVKVAAIVLALLIALPVSYLITSAIGKAGAPKEVTVPSLIGKTFEEAELELGDLDLKIELEAEVVSVDYEEGLIVSQDPLEGMPVKAGKTIKVSISKGAGQNTIPSVIGRTLSDAIFLLESYGYEKGGVSEEYSEMPAGVIIRQSPDAGSTAEPGTSVGLVISLGEEVTTRVVPSLLGLTLDEAKKTLEREQLVLSDSVEYAPSDEYKEGKICGQSISPGHSADKGTKIKVTLSTGPDESAGDVTVNIPISYNAAQNEVFYLTVMVSDSSGVTTPINYEQRIKSNGSETFQVVGKGQGSVKIYFDNALVQEYAVDFDKGAVL